MDPNMSVADALNSRRPKQVMARLAQLVFDRTELACMKAFSQFSNPEDLGFLIEARRKKVFDFGTLIQVTSKGSFRYPTNTNAVLSAAKLAQDGEYAKIDLRSIGLVDEEGNVMESKLYELCPAAPKSTKAKATPPPEPDPIQVPEPEPVSPPVPTPHSFQEPGDAAVTISAPAPSNEAQPAPYIEAEASVLISTQDVMSRLDELSTNLANALQLVVDENKKEAMRKNDFIEDEIGYVKAEVENLKAGVVGLAMFLNVVNENIQSVYAFLDPMEELPGPPPEAGWLLGQAAPEDIKERVEASAQQQEEVPAAPEPSGDTEIPQSKEELFGYGLDQLRTLAGRVGVPNPESVPFKRKLIDMVWDRI